MSDRLTLLEQQLPGLEQELAANPDHAKWCELMTDPEGRWPCDCGVWDLKDRIHFLKVAISLEKGLEKAT